MTFYNELSKHYDKVFPLNPSKITFIKKFIREEDRILDIACGNGSEVVALAKEGYEVEGIDLDSAMIEEAKNQVDREKVRADFQVGDMLHLSNQFENYSFETVLCTGNSLVHLLEEDQIRSTLKSMYHLLREQGILILQIINYDRIIDQKITALPLIEDIEKDLKFIREYEYDQETNIIDFITTLQVEKEIYSNRVPLFALRKNQLVEMLQDAGFEGVKVFSDFKGNPYHEDGYATIVVASKN